MALDTSAYRPPAGSITMFTTKWCGYCRMLKFSLNRLGIDFREIDIERDPDAVAFVMAVNDGNQTVPTVVYSDGSTATNPSGREVQALTTTLT